MTSNFPMTILATLGDVTVFQTSAFQTPASTNADNDDNANTGNTGIEIIPDADFLKSDQQMRQIGQASYGEGNIGLHVNDNAAKVLANRMRLLATVNQHLRNKKGSAIDSLHWVNQVHGKQVYDVDTHLLNMQPADADALVSHHAHVGLAIMTADCIPVVLYQPNTGKIAAIHAGWQGLACGVIKATVERFTEMGQIIAWIGVSISQANYEADRQVRDKLLSGCVNNQLLKNEYIEAFDQLFCIDKEEISSSIDKSLQNNIDKLRNNVTISPSKVNIDLPKLAVYQLLSGDVKIGNKEPYLCSYANDYYYSYRRQTHLQQPATGRMALIIARSG